MTFARQPVAEFAALVADTSPGPAGGSTLAVTAAFAAALVELTARLSDDDAAAADAQRLRARLFELADEDAQAYREFMRAKTDETRARTIEVPEAIGAHARELVTLAERLEREGNPRLVGDAIAARLLARAAEEGAARLVELNRAA